MQTQTQIQPGPTRTTTTTCGNLPGIDYNTNTNTNTNTSTNTPPVASYQGLPSPTYQTEFDEGAEEEFDAGGFFTDYFEGPRTDFQG